MQVAARGTARRAPRELCSVAGSKALGAGAVFLAGDALNLWASGWEITQFLVTPAVVFYVNLRKAAAARGRAPAILSQQFHGEDVLEALLCSFYACDVVIDITEREFRRGAAGPNWPACGLWRDEAVMCLSYRGHRQAAWSSTPSKAMGTLADLDGPRFNEVPVNLSFL